MEPSDIPDNGVSLDGAGVPQNEVEVPVDQNALPEVNMLTETEEVIIDVEVPATGEVIINPYRLDVTVDGQTTRDQIASPEFTITNRGNVPVTVKVSSTGTTSGDALLKSFVPEDYVKTKWLYMYAEFWNMSDGKPAWSGEFTDSENQLLIRYSSQKADLLTLDTGAEGIFKLFGAAGYRSPDLWHAEDGAAIQFTYTFKKAPEAAQAAACDFDYDAYFEEDDFNSVEPDDVNVDGVESDGVDAVEPARPTTTPTAAENPKPSTDADMKESPKPSDTDAVESNKPSTDTDTKESPKPSETDTVESNKPSIDADTKESPKPSETDTVESNKPSTDADTKESSESSDTDAVESNKPSTDTDMKESSKPSDTDAVESDKPSDADTSAKEDTSSNADAGTSAGEDAPPASNNTSTDAGQDTSSGNADDAKESDKPSADANVYDESLVQL